VRDFHLQPGFDVLASDNHVIAVAKPAGIPTVPDESGDESMFDMVRNWIEEEFHKPGRAFLGIVHRIDRPVSGIVLFARTSKAAARLSRSFQERRVKKTYAGVVGADPGGTSGESSGLGREWLLKDRKQHRVKAVAPGTEGAREALTHWRVLGRHGDRWAVELLPETGRPHQLRHAMATLRAPLMGDLRYGASSPLPDRSIALHAMRLELDHPVGQSPLKLACRVPQAPVWSFPEAEGDLQWGSD